MSIEWTPQQALELGLEMLDDPAAATGERLFGRVAQQMRRRRLGVEGEDDPVAGQVSELLVELYEHLASAQDDAERRRFLREQCGQRVLDFGCGTGLYALDLALRGCHVTCIDINPIKLVFVIRAARLLGVEKLIDFVPSAYYDSVICIDVLDHLARPAHALHRLAELLPAGGNLFLHARFTGDGAQASGREAVDTTFDALAHSFDRAPDRQQPGELLEWWVRHNGESPITGDHLVADPLLVKPQALAGLVPRLHPDLQVRSSSDGGTILTGSRFYLAPTVVGPHGASIIERCDGRTPVASILERPPRNLSRDVTRRFLLRLWRRHYLIMCNADVPIDAPVPGPLPACGA